MTQEILTIKAVISDAFHDISTAAKDKNSHDSSKQVSLMETISFPKINENDKTHVCIDSSSCLEIYQLSPKSKNSTVNKTKIQDKQDFSSNIGTLIQKITSISSQVDTLFRALCTNCSFDVLHINNENLPNVCKVCHSVFCNVCSNTCKCAKCGKQVCSSHSVKCCLCNKRSCKEKICISDFRICQLCEYTYCQEHFDEHKKFNQSEAHKVRCNTGKQKIPPLSSKGMEDFLKNLIHATNITELRLRIM